MRFLALPDGENALDDVDRLVLPRVHVQARSGGSGSQLGHGQRLVPSLWAVAYTTTRLYVEGNDELQRRRAVTACAIGCGAGIACVIVDAIRIAVTGDDPDGPSRTLAIAAAAWLLTEVLDPRR